MAFAAGRGEHGIWSFTTKGPEHVPIIQTPVYVYKRDTEELAELFADEGRTEGSGSV